MDELERPVAKNKGRLVPPAALLVVDDDNDLLVGGAEDVDEGVVLMVMMEPLGVDEANVAFTDRRGSRCSMGVKATDDPRIGRPPSTLLCGLLLAEKGWNLGGVCSIPAPRNALARGVACNNPTDDALSSLKSTVSAIPLPWRARMTCESR